MDWFHFTDIQWLGLVVILFGFWIVTILRQISQTLIGIHQELQGGGPR